MPRVFHFVACCVLPAAFVSGALAQAVCAAPKPAHAVARSEDRDGAEGDWFVAHHQTQCAVEAYRRGLKIDPSSAPLHYSLGMAFYAAGSMALAADEMEQTIRLDPRFDQAFLVLGIIAHDRGDRDGALKQWQKAAMLNPGSSTVLDWIARTRMEAGQFTEALDLLATAPDSEDLAVDALIAASKASLVEKGIATAQRRLAAHPDWKGLRRALATVLVQRNRFEDAMTLLRAALKDEPNSVDLQVLTLRVLILMGDSVAAQPYADRLLADEPNSFDALYLSGLLKRQNGEPAAALPLLERAARLQPDHFDVCFNLGIAYAKVHRTPEARAMLLHAAKLPDAGAEVHFQLASVLRASGDADGADAEMKVYQQRLAARARHDELVSLSAQAAQKLEAGDASGAADVERSILGRFPDEAVHWYDLALALDRLGDARGEATALQHAVALQPGFAMALNQLGYLEARSGETKQAEAAFRAAIASAPQYAEGQNNLGSLLAEAGRDQEAQTYFRAALAANPRLVDGWINLAASLAAGGEYGEARKAAEGAMRLQPGNPDAKRLLDLLASAPVPAARTP